MFHESDTAVPQEVLTVCVCQISASFLINLLIYQYFEDYGASRSGQEC